MNANIVVLNGETLVNLSKDTAVESDVAVGKTFHKADGSLAVGTNTGESLPEYDGKVIITGEPTQESGGLDINGVIREYEVNAGASVSAGDFVEFVNKFSRGEFHPGASNYISACKLDNNRVLVAYQDAGNASYGTAVVLTIDGTIVRAGVDKVFSTATTTSISVCALTDSKAVVSYGVTNSSSCSAVVLTIVDTDITVGTAKQIQSYMSDALGTAIIGLTESKALVFASYYNWTVLCQGVAYLLAIDGTTISVSNSVVISSTGKRCLVQRICAAKITNSAVIFAFEQSADSSASWASDYLEVGVVTIDSNDHLSVGRTVIAQSTSGSSSTARDFFSSLCVLNENTALIVYNRVSDNFLNCRMLSINGLTIGTISTTTITNTAITNSYVSICALSERKVLVSYYGKALILTIDIDNETVSVGETITFNGSSGTHKSTVPFSESSVLVVFNNGGTGKYASLSIDDTTITVNEASGTFVEKATSNLHNVGVAKTSGAEGDIVEVYCAV